MDKQKIEELHYSVLGLYFLGIEIENFEESKNIFGNSSYYFSVPEKYSDDFIEGVADNEEERKKLKTEDGIIEICKENIIKIITSYCTVVCGEDDEDIVKGVVNNLRFYAKVRDEEWTIEKGKGKIEQLKQEIEKLEQVKNEWKEV